ncbi:LamG domain-containing protein [Miltoncostaea oceani]|uniref:LamG domain-containing protein n=1 Tax=Miltoncostaea oceani TaxID=2843216 RepID=UPI001C3DC947|nr:LamG domain-containing protein [Miltoncostaea oceani]
MTSRRAFTLIELMVTMVVLLVLLTIATPSFQNTRNAAQDTVARASVTDSYYSAKAIWNAERVYPPLATIVSRLSADHPDLTFVTNPPGGSDPETVYVQLLTDETIELCARSRSRTAYCLQATEPGNRRAEPLVLTSVPDNSDNPSAQVAFSTLPGVTSIRCVLDGGPSAPCTSPWTGSGLSAGPHTLTVTVSGAGIATTSKVARWSRVLNAPSVQITGRPRNGSHWASGTITFSTTGTIASRECRIDGGPWQNCASGNFPFSGLAVGDHSVDVRVTNATGSDTASFSWRRADYDQAVLASVPNHYYRMEQADGNISWDSMHNPSGSGIVWTNWNGQVGDARIGAGRYGLGRHMFGTSQATIGGITPWSWTNTSFTIEYWLSLNASGSCTIGRGVAANSQLLHHCFHFDQGNGQARMQNSFYFDDMTTAGVFAPNTWYHIATTYDVATDRSRIYRNGVMIAESSVGPLVGNSSNVTYAGHGVGGGFLLGRIDEIATYNRALTPQEIADRQPVQP